MAQSLETNIPTFNGIMPPPNTVAYNFDGDLGPDVAPVAPFTYFEHPLDEGVDDPEYWSAIASLPPAPDEEPFMLGILLVDGTFRWSFEAATHTVLRDADRRAPYVARVEINKYDDPGAPPYVVIIVDKDHIASANDVMAFLDRNLSDPSIYIESSIYYAQNHSEQFIPLYSGTLDNWHKRFA